MCNHRNYACAAGLLLLAVASPALAQTIYFTDSVAPFQCQPFSGSIHRQVIGGSSETVRVFANTSLVGIALDTANNYIYWSESSTIRRATRAGCGPATIVSGQSTQDLEIDTVGGKLYWHNFDSIRRCNLDGSGVETIVSGLTGGGAIALDRSAGKVYYTVSNTNPARLDRANLDGSNVQNVATAGNNTIEGVAVDSVNGKVYWTVQLLNQVNRANLDGTSPQTIVNANSPTDIVVDPAAGKILWVEPSGSNFKIRSANLDGSGPQDVVFNTQRIVRIAVGDVTNTPCVLGDMNNDGVVNSLDIALFVLKLLNP